MDDYISVIYPVYCGWRDRLLAMYSPDESFSNDTIDAVFISNFATRPLSQVKVNIKIDSIKINDKAQNQNYSYKMIGNTCYLRMFAEEKGKYWVYGGIENIWCWV